MITIRTEPRPRWWPRRHAEHQVCDRRWRRRGQDLPPHLLLHQPVPRGVCPHRVRYLRSQPHDRVSQQTFIICSNNTSSIWHRYSWETAIIIAYRCQHWGSLLLQGGAGLFDPVRHGGPGGLRPAAAHLLPRHQCVPGLLQRGAAHQFRERQGEVDPRD